MPRAAKAGLPARRSARCASALADALGVHDDVRDAAYQSAQGARSDCSSHGVEAGSGDEPAMLRGRDGLTDIEREILGHRYEIAGRTVY